MTETTLKTLVCFSFFFPGTIWHDIKDVIHLKTKTKWTQLIYSREEGLASGAICQVIDDCPNTPPHCRPKHERFYSDINTHRIAIVKNEDELKSVK